MARQRVVIVGGGFGGLYAAKALRRAAVDLTLVDKRNFHLFQPLLYQVATGSLSPGEIAAPLRSVLSRQKNTRVLLGEAVDLDPRRKALILADGGTGSGADDEVPYDTLVIATGARDAWFGHDEWEKYAAPLKTIEEATHLRHRILYAFEAAERERDADKRRQWLTFVVVGAGPTGVELAGALSEIANDTLKHDFRSIDPTQARILLLDGNSRVLPSYPADLSHKAEASLLRLGVRPYTAVRVVDVDESGVTMQHGDGRTEHLVARTVIWAAGVRASAFGEILANRAGAKLEKGGRAVVGPDLSLLGYPDIFVIGDLAYRTDRQGQPLPGVAQVAMQQGSYVARIIRQQADGKERSKPFQYHDRGDLAVIGRAAAVARIPGLHLSGLLAWLIWLFVHLMYIVQFSNRLLVFVHWGFLYLTFDRGARLITGEQEDS
jgi:NADH dehydrogenase